MVDKDYIFRTAHTRDDFKAKLAEFYEQGHKGGAASAHKELGEYIYMQVEELATFLGHFYYGLTLGSGRVVILRDPMQNPLRVRYMSLEQAVSLYNRRHASRYFYITYPFTLHPYAQEAIRAYPNKGLKLDIQRNSKCKYGLCSSLFGGVPAK